MQPDSVNTAPDALIEAYRKAWQRILTEQKALLLDPLAYRRRRRLQELQVAIEQALEGLDVQTRDWINTQLPQVQQLGLATGAVQATGLTSVAIPALHDPKAAELAAERLYTDLLAATQGVRDSTKALIREIARDQTFQSIAGGDTAQQAGRAMEDILARKGIFAVAYKDGSVHGLDDYSDMLLRTTTAQAYNAAAIDGAQAYGVDWFEVLDGPSCGWLTHTTGGLALGKIVTAEQAAEHPLSHPRCRRSFAARPDVTSAEEAKTAKRLTTPEQAAAQLAADEERAQQLLSRQNRRRAAARASKLPASERHAARLQARSSRLAARRVRTGV